MYRNIEDFYNKLEVYAPDTDYEIYDPVWERRTYSRTDKFFYPNKLRQVNIQSRKWRGNRRESKKQLYEFKKNN